MFTVEVYYFVLIVEQIGFEHPFKYFENVFFFFLICRCYMTTSIKVIGKTFLKSILQKDNLLNLLAG